MTRTIRTADGVEQKEGDRTFNFYDGWWGRIGPIDEQGWFTLKGDKGQVACLNGERVALELPRSNPYYDIWFKEL